MAVEAMTGLLSKGITLGYRAAGGTGAFTNLPGLQSIPSLGGDIDKVETTTLAVENRTYINGLRDYGDLEFKFLYATDEADVNNYVTMRSLEEDASGVPIKYDFEVALPDGTKFDFTGTMANSIDEADVNVALTFTCKIGLSSEIDMVV